MNQFMKYILIDKASKNSEFVRGSYHCSRSAPRRKSTSTGKRKRGSNKSEHLCTSRVKVDKTEGGLSVMYYKTHSGHALEPSRSTGIPLLLQKQIARELEAGIPRGEVAKKIRESGVSELARLVTTQDVTNVGRKFNISVNLNHSRNHSRSRKDRGDDDDFDYFDLHTPSPGPAFDLERLNALFQEALVLVTDANSASVLENNLKSAISTLQQESSISQEEEVAVPPPQQPSHRKRASAPRKRPRSSPRKGKGKGKNSIEADPDPVPAEPETGEQFIFVMGENNSWFRV
jgi:hypothetical protein